MRQPKWVLQELVWEKALQKFAKTYIIAHNIFIIVKHLEHYLYTTTINLRWRPTFDALIVYVSIDLTSVTVQLIW